MSRSWSLQEVARHNTADSCWVIIENKVYDVTEFLPDHPGGVRLLLNFAGRDATAASRPFHSPDTVVNSLPLHKHLGDLDHISVKALKRGRAPQRKVNPSGRPVTGNVPA